MQKAKGFSLSRRGEKARDTEESIGNWVVSMSIGWIEDRR